MQRRAVIDVGSNSVLLLVAESNGTDWVPVFESSEVTALGEGTKETGLLSEAAIERTLAAIKRGFDKAEEFGAGEVIAGATMAARIASNAAEFLARGLAQGTPIRILSGEEEAELGFLAVANDPAFAGEDRISIIDPGGHSTELVVADRTPTGWTTIFKKSFPVGTLGLRGTLMPLESPDVKSILDSVVYLDDLLAVDGIPDNPGTPVVLGATGTNLITIRERMTTWDPARVHGQTLIFGEVSQGLGEMMRRTDAERAQIVGIESGRERTIHIGSLILERFMQRLHTNFVRVSVRGWRYALLEREFAINS